MVREIKIVLRDQLFFFDKRISFILNSSMFRLWWKFIFNYTRAILTMVKYQHGTENEGSVKGSTVFGITRCLEKDTMEYSNLLMVISTKPKLLQIHNIHHSIVLLSTKKFVSVMNKLATRYNFRELNLNNIVPAEAIRVLIHWLWSWQ